MMRWLCLLLCLAGAFAGMARGKGEGGAYGDKGRLILTPFASAPFPHPARADGHKHNDDFFSAAEHYRDSTVALFAPKGFRPGRQIDFVVHFHGWNNTVTNALAKYRLIDQFAASGRNAILIAPQGPRDAEDSFGGKLEDPGGFARFMAEAMKTLTARGVIGTNAAIGRIILSAHSGGYEVASAILACGGLTDHVREVWLFDALYAHAGRFVVWFDHEPGRFVDLFTAHGGTLEETRNLMQALRGAGVPYYDGSDTASTVRDLRNHLVFLFSDLPHDNVMQGRNEFETLLRTSALARTDSRGKMFYNAEAKP